MNWSMMYLKYELVAWYVTNDIPAYNIVCWSNDTEFIIQHWLAGNKSTINVFIDRDMANKAVLEMFNKYKLFKKTKEDVISTLSLFEWFDESQALGIY